LPISGERDRRDVCDRSPGRATKRDEWWTSSSGAMIVPRPEIDRLAIRGVIECDLGVGHPVRMPAALGDRWITSVAPCGGRDRLLCWRAACGVRSGDLTCPRTDCTTRLDGYGPTGVARLQGDGVEPRNIRCHPRWDVPLSHNFPRRSAAPGPVHFAARIAIGEGVGTPS
jgi:hypothetical protein